MEGGHLVMRKKERERLIICGRIKDGGMTLSQGSNQLCLSYRQMLRVYGRFSKDLEGTLTLHYKGQKVFYDAIEARPEKLEPAAV